MPGRQRPPARPPRGDYQWSGDPADAARRRARAVSRGKGNIYRPRPDLGGEPSGSGVSFRTSTQKPPTKWWTKALLIGLFGVLIGSIGAGRFFGDALRSDENATPSATAQ